MDIAQLVKNTYFDRFDELELEYQLHFASRLYSWSNDQKALEKLRSLRTTLVPTNTTTRLANLHHIKEELAVKNFERDVNNYEQRKPYFEKYPDLLLVHNALFRIRHWHCIYGVDERALLFELLPHTEIDKLIHALRNDTDAIRTLSTYAINTFYLYDRLYQSENTLDIEALFDAGRRYDKTDIKQLQLLTYLYTHCIIGETLFYFQPIKTGEDTYQKMLFTVEQIFLENFERINLDNKLEFLVCAKICGYNAKIEERIYTEVGSSLHEDGYIVDRLNRNINPAKQNFLMSEHRNVLYLMSQTTPQFISKPVQ
jgi:hypothetical protein